MLSSFVTKSILAIGAAAVLVTAAAFIASVVPEAKAATRVTTAFNHLNAAGDRPSAAAAGSACSHSWPNYEQSCQFDLRRPVGEMRTVRVIAVR
jgi:hypothetical protein